MPLACVGDFLHTISSAPHFTDENTESEWSNDLPGVTQRCGLYRRQIRDPSLQLFPHLGTPDPSRFPPWWALGWAGQGLQVERSHEENPRGRRGPAPRIPVFPLSLTPYRFPCPLLVSPSLHWFSVRIFFGTVTRRSGTSPSQSVQRAWRAAAAPKR